MHGLINHSFQRYMCDSYGQDAWLAVAVRAGVSPPTFEPMLTYDDAITPAVLDAMAAVLHRTRVEVMEDIGAHLVSHPKTEAVRRLLRFGGMNFEDFLHSLDPAQTYGQDRWCLYVDMDEQFDFEGRETIGSQGLTRYLEAQGHTALMAQMLEMFPRAPLADVQDLSFAEALETFAYYDISTVESFAYHSDRIGFHALLRDNVLSSDAMQFKFGGVRGKVFGEACCLTKHPLVFNGPQVVPAPHPHLSQHVTVSDFSAVIRHYKFAGNVAARDAASAGSGDLAHGEDRARLEVLSRTEDLTLYSADAQAWAWIAPLAEAGFLVVSQNYAAFLAGQTA